MKIVVRAAAAFALIGAFLLTWDVASPPAHASSQITLGSFHHSWPAKMTTYHFKHAQVVHGQRWIGMTMIPRNTSRIHTDALCEGSSHPCSEGTAHIEACLRISPGTAYCNASAGGWYVQLNFTGSSQFNGSSYVVEADGHSETNAADNSAHLFTQISSSTCASTGAQSTSEENCHYNFQLKDTSISNTWCGVVATTGGICDSNLDATSYVDAQWVNGGAPGVYVLWGSDAAFCGSSGINDVGCVSSNGTYVSQP